ncbi:post-PEP-CTERM-1 domain-containing protein [Massilia sp. LXY-6]|uniref:post-PEP-CTERM-1 domain-containing protein n=1 Tax=Massilia sp. LXY-6 TaxID=3379823 RepID=UPI003EE3D6A7
MSKQKMMTLTMLAALCVLASLSMHAKAQGKENKPGQEGMVIARDPETGKLRAPTPEELRALRARTPASAAAMAGVPQESSTLSRRDGARGVRLGAKSQVYEVVTRGADGKLSSQCVQGEAAAEEALRHPANTEQKEDGHEAH